MNLIHEWPAHGSGLPDVPGYPLHLLSNSTDKLQGSQWIEPPDGPSSVTVHPESTSLADGDLAWIESVNGRLDVRVRHDPAQRRGVALLAKGGQQRYGRGVNVLTTARLTDIGEGGAIYDERVRLVRNPRGPG